MIYIRSIFFTIITLTITACNSGVIFNTYEPIPNAIWNEKDTIIIEANIEDTLSLYDIFINVRNTSDYSYSNLFIFMSLEGANQTLLDTINIILADDNGKWLGKGIGSLWDSEFIIRKHIKFPSSGKYTFKLQQGMRNSELTDISDIGIRIEKSKK